MLKSNKRLFCSVLFNLPKTKYEVRKQIRREFACARDVFYAELMDNPTDKLFYKLIQNNQSSASKVAHSMLMNG